MTQNPMHWAPFKGDPARRAQNPEDSVGGHVFRIRNIGPLFPNRRHLRVKQQDESMTPTEWAS